MEFKGIIYGLLLGFAYLLNESAAVPTHYQQGRDPFADLAQGLSLSMNNIATGVFASASSHGNTATGHSVRAEAVASSSSSGSGASPTAVAYAQTSSSNQRRRTRPTRPTRPRRPTRSPF